MKSAQHLSCNTSVRGRDLIATAVRRALWSSALAALAIARAEDEPPAPPSVDQGEMLQQVVVTANRRSESAIDVPYNITAVTSEEMQQAGISTTDDLARLVPGLIQAQQGPGLYGSGNSFIMRGLNAASLEGLALSPEQTVSPVSTYLGDIPVFFPLTLEDISRVEVLSGPQGTLYGSGSAGGTIRFIPAPPVLDKFDANVNVSSGYTDHASQPNADVSGMFNVPIADTLALRVVAGYKRLAGFIDDVALVKTSNGTSLGVPVERVPGDVTSGFVLAPQNDTNNSDDSFVRAMLRWKPKDALTVDLTYQHQSTRLQDSQQTNPYWSGGIMDYSVTDFPGSRGADTLGTPGGNLFPNSTTYIPAGGDYRDTELVKTPNDRMVDVAGVDASADLGFATISSTTSYTDNRAVFVTDDTSAYTNVTNPSGGIPLVALYNFYPRLTAPTFWGRDDNAATEEVRLTSTWKEPVDYVAGLYFSDERSHDTVNQYTEGIRQFSSETTNFAAPNAAYGDLAWYTNRDMKFIDRAIFGEVTWHLTRRWQLTGGARVFSQAFSNDFLQLLPLCGIYCGDGISPNQNLGESVVREEQTFRHHIFKANTSFEIVENTKAYFTYSEGFRRGGANTVPTAGYFASLPQYLSFKPDFAKNYEVGIKGVVAQRLSYTVALYNINWTNFQFEGETPSALPAVFNGGTATSRGTELELHWRPIDRLTISASYSYTDAYLTSSFQIADYPQYGLVDKLPLVVAVSGPKGASLPGAPKNAGSLTADYRLPLFDGALWTLDLNGSVSYHGSSSAALPSSALFPANIPSATFVNARVGLNYGEHWTIDLVGQNLNNELGMSNGVPPGHDGPLSFANIAQPRTISLGLHWRY